MVITMPPANYLCLVPHGHMDCCGWPIWPCPLLDVSPNGVACFPAFRRPSTLFVRISIYTYRLSYIRCHVHMSQGTSMFSPQYTQEKQILTTDLEKHPSVCFSVSTWNPQHSPVTGNQVTPHLKYVHPFLVPLCLYIANDSDPYVLLWKMLRPAACNLTFKAVPLLIRFLNQFAITSLLLISGPLH